MEMRMWKQYIMEEEIDLCCATETHMDARRQKEIEDVFETDYHCILKRRKKRKKGDYGSGGLAVLVRRGMGVPKVAKNKGSDEILWVEVDGLGGTIYIAVVYLVPKKSSRYGDNNGVRRELEEGIYEFRARGMVVVIGDVNSRIGECVPLEGADDGRKRNNSDKKMNENGREWIQLMRRTGMVMLTGLYGRAEYTCYNYKGNSVVDHICIDKENSYKVRGIESKK